jgi:hypothetical protein
MLSFCPLDTSPLLVVFLLVEPVESGDVLRNMGIVEDDEFTAGGRVKGGGGSGGKSYDIKSSA